MTTRKIPLSTLQKRLSEWVADPQNVEGTLSDLGILDQPPISVEKRLSIYQVAFRLRLHESLEEDFPEVRWWVGRRSFEKLMEDYLRAYPSTYWTLAQLGENLSEFLSRSPAKVCMKYPFLGELARFEWCQILSMLATCPKSADFSVLAGMSEAEQQKVVLILAPSVHLFTSAWNILGLIHPKTKKLEKKKMKKKCRIVIHQNFEGLDYFQVSPIEWEFLQAMSQGKNLGELMDLGQKKKIPGTQFSEWFSSWVFKKVITGMQF